MGEGGEMSCPKCGHAVMVGPRYKTVQDVSGYGPTVEFLAYTCSQCGYEKRKNTQDYHPPMTNEKLQKYLKGVK